jgi:hypothetical protein
VEIGERVDERLLVALDGMFGDARH